MKTDNKLERKPERKDKPKITNWSLRWRLMPNGSIIRRIVGETENHPRFFNNTEISEVIKSFNGREVTIDSSKVPFVLGKVDPSFLEIIRENGFTMSTNDPINHLEEQLFKVDYTSWAKVSYQYGTKNTKKK